MGANDQSKPDFNLAEEYLELLYRQYIIYMGSMTFPMITMVGFLGNILEFFLDKYAATLCLFFFFFFFFFFVVVASCDDGANPHPPPFNALTLVSFEPNRPPTTRDRYRMLYICRKRPKVDAHMKKFLTFFLVVSALFSIFTFPYGAMWVLGAKSFGPLELSNCEFFAG